MTKMTLTSLALAAGVFAANPAIANEVLVAEVGTNYKANIAKTLQLKMQDPAFKQALLTQLKQTKAPALFSQVMADKMSSSTQNMLDKAMTQGVYPEVWLHNPANAKADENLLIAYAPKGNEKSWSFIPAIDLATGEAVQLEVDQAPERAVLVVETHGQYSMENFITDVNIKLSNTGAAPSAKSVETARSSVVETTKLTKISLQNDQEPWIKGGAEIFTFVAGVFDNNNPAIKAVGLPYLDHDNTNYYPNQLIINWNDYAYNAVNFSMYEEDSETNYKDLAKAIVTAVGAIGSLAGFEPSIAIAEITNRIQDAMPDSWYTDDHDYVDTCYTLVKGESLNDHWCAAGNAKISTRPFNLQSN
jgi:hypothetical protein